MKKILIILLMVMPLLASAQSTFTVESKGVKYSFPLEGTTITITNSSDEGNDDDPSEGDIKKKIVGSWRTVHVKGWIYDDDGNPMYVDKDVQEGVEWDENLRLDFKSDGTYCSYVYCEEHGWEICDKDGTYQISGNILTTRYEDEEGVDVGGGTILSISDDTLILEGTLEEDGSLYKCVYTLKRIK